jgi:hypothetical protein
MEIHDLRATKRKALEIAETRISVIEERHHRFSEDQSMNSYIYLA